MPTSSEIRQQFIDYFVEQHSHRFVPSCPVVPHDDPTLLFTNAGMNQFKEVFLGTDQHDYRRAANTQKCIRAGGKHNDLEDVGNDTYHHTFFEMLGNWSFGDYFKKEAIAWAWDLLTRVWGLDKSRLHATVFEGDATEGLEPDDESARLWKSITDIDPSHIHGGSKKDNFWEMGETGPCGPCSEIHIDLTPDKSGGHLVNADPPSADVIEIWNLVFIQFNRDTAGTLSALPARHVDTGMGLERICAVLQAKASNYDTDLFKPIFEAIRSVTGAPTYGSKPDDKIDIAYRVIADHIRCLTFALTDGALPSNEGRGYVLRRILRRAVRHGYQTLGVTEPFLHRLVPAVVDAMGDPFPELTQDTQRVVGLVKEEEESFAKTLDRGIELFEKAAQRGGDLIQADDAFKLHDTYGFPLDLTQVMAQERGMTVDVMGFDQLMSAARQKARAAGGGRATTSLLVEAVQRDHLPATEFMGDHQTQINVKTFCWLYQLTASGCEQIEKAIAGQTLALVTGHTPFYAETGGQVGDTGVVENQHGGVVRVRDTVKIGQVHVHIGVVETGVFGQVLPTGDHAAVELAFRVDQYRRQKIMANHTATHLMNRALRQVLGDHVQQKGSLVDDQKLRFDFSHQTVVTADQTDRIEQMVNADIAANLPVDAQETQQDQALSIHGLRAVFGEKYPPKVRVISIGVPVFQLLAKPDQPQWYDYSIELCGGTHVAKTGDAGHFVLVGEEAVAKGVRRLTALTGQAAQQSQSLGKTLLDRLAALQDSPPDQLAAAVAQLATVSQDKPLPLAAKARFRNEITALQKIVRDHQKQRSKRSTGAVTDQAHELAQQSNGLVIVAAVDDADATALRTAMDVFRKKKPQSAIMLAGVSGEKVSFVAAVPSALIDRGLKAGDWVQQVARAAGGGGGGRPEMAQAGGKDPAKVAEALRVGREFAASKLQ